MPLVRRPSGAAEPRATEPADAGAALSDPDPEVRWSAARSLGTDPSAIGVLGRALDVETDPRVREALATALIRIGGDAAGVLLPHLRSEDAALRTLVIEALQNMPEAVLPRMPDLLADPDPDVRLLSAELARGMPLEEGSTLIADALAGEQHPNVAAAMIEVLAEIGTADAVDALQIARRRFANEPFLPFAVDIALKRLARSPE